MYGADADQRSAFREAEKKYQRHFTQKLKKKADGRFRGSRGRVLLPTDFGGVMDFAQPATWEGRVTEVESEDCRCYLLHGRPGFCYIPAAVPPMEQAKLAFDCLASFPQPPAHTNHTRAHGDVPDLWRASGAGSRWIPRDASSEAAGAASCSEAAEGPPGGLASHKARTSCVDQDRNATGMDSPASGSAPQNLHGGRCRRLPPAAASRPGDCSERKDSGSGEGPASGANREGSFGAEAPEAGAGRLRGRWMESAAEGVGLAAGKLLEKLRWACLGPNFDWSGRRYLYNEPHLPLPESLISIAQRCASVAQNAANMGQQANFEGPSDGSCPEHADPTCLFTSSDCRSSLPSTESRPQYQPDAALINYYSSGDTLGGHCDDVERDMSKPIVSISLGCDAIFLLGGLTKDEAPDAMLVRSGDAMVLGGQARRCYHGMPRILEGTAPQWPGVDAAEHEGKRMIEHMQGRRINISIRETV